MSAWTPSPAAKAASDYFNSLPFEQRCRLAPLLENYRQMGLAEAREMIEAVTTRIDGRVARIRELHKVAEEALR
jgi:cell fate (sporulation/competence/biofilm development) regulator YmcA (YheA/YmcA/DUF963 family)